MSDILKVLSKPVFDSSITKIEDKTINCTNPLSLGNNDLIQFQLNTPDSLVFLPDAYFTIEGTLKTKDGTAPTKTKFSEAGVLHLFSRAEVKLNNQTLETVYLPGQVGLVKLLTIFSEGSAREFQSLGFGADIKSDSGEFHALVPLKLLFGVAYDHQRVIVNSKIDIALTRSRTNNNALLYTEASATEETRLTLQKIELHAPYVTIDDANRLEFLKIFDKDAPLNIIFRSWDLFQYPELPQTKKQIWSVLATTQIEKPRFALLNFQTAREDTLKKNASQFDHCSLKSLKCLLNNEPFPLEEVEQSFSNKNYNWFFNSYCKFPAKFNGHGEISPYLSFDSYKTEGPIFIIDCSRQKEVLKSGAVDVRLSFESENAFPSKTVANCIIIHDNVYAYRPMTNVTRKFEG